MEFEHANQTVGKVALVVSVCLCAAFGLTVTTLAIPSVRGWFSTASVAYPIGSLTDLPREWYADSPYTLVIFARSSCAACQAAKPFHKRLVASTAESAETRAILVSSSGDDEQFKYAAELGLATTSVRTVRPGTLKVHRVPTLVLVDGKGEVLESWERPPAGDEEQGIVNTIVSRSAPMK